MISKTFTYTDWNGLERTETHYFNLSEAEIVEKEFGTEGGYSAMLQKIVDTKDTPKLIKIWKDIIFWAYGVKSADGRRFEKSEELSIAFSQTPMYVQLYMSLVRDTNAAIEFANGLLPAAERQAIQQAASAAVPAAN
jgi:hypothetical protein